jgi:prepilin-type N-terminal cleavage/methylation domain-containing protein
MPSGGHSGREMTTHGDERGFTLIELMIVVGIIAILAGILIPNFVNARAQAQTSACESNLRSIATALELLYADQQDYGPAGTRDVTPDNLKGASGVFYLNNTPKDPASLDQSKNYQVTVTAAAAGNPASYVIQCPGTHAGSTLAKLQKNATTDGSVCGPACTATTLYYAAGSGIGVQ